MKVKLTIQPEEDPRFYKMLSRRAGECAECEQDIRLSELIIWDSEDRKAYCHDCGLSLI